MKQNRITKRILAVMMSFLMAFSSIQGYVKAETESMNTENEEEVINVNDSEEELDPDFNVESEDEEESNKDFEDEIIDDSATSSDTEEKEPAATDTDVIDPATGSDAEANTEEIITPDTDIVWEDVEGAQIYGLLGMQYYMRSNFALTNEGKDISDMIDVPSAKASLNGVTIQQGNDYTVKGGSTFEFKFEWQPANADQTIQANDYFTIDIATISGLQYSNQTAKTDLRISGIKVGVYYLTYANSELKFHIEFNENIIYFQDISGFFKGSSTFKDVTEATVNEFSFMDEYYGELTVEKKPEVVTPPSTPSGTAWKPSLPNDFNKNEKPSLKKDVKWFGNDAHQIEYRAGFFDLIKQYEDGNPFEGQTYENVILVDELDANQKYVNVYGNAPFFIEIPIFYYGTNNAVGYLGTNNEEVVFKSGTQAANQPGMTSSSININSSNFTKFTSDDGDVEALVESTPRSWGIVITSTNTQKLIINLGKLGSLDQSEAITMNDINSGWKLTDYYKTLQNRIKTAEKNIEEYENDSNSPLVLLQTRLTSLDTYYRKNDPSLAYIDELNAFIEAVEDYINDPSIQTVPVLDENIKAKALNASADVLASLNNYRKDITVYNNNKAAYIQKWQDKIDIYKKTIEYYIPEEIQNDTNKKADAPVYGFIIKYRTEVTNLSQTTVTNNVMVKTGTVEYESSIIAKHNFTAGIKGNYINGDVVLVKADSKYGYKEENLGNTAVKGMAGVEFEVYEVGSATPLQLMPASAGHYVYIAGNHTGDAKFTQTLVTDANGAIAISSLPSMGNYYFKEVSNPNGYYTGQNTMIPFTVDKNQITYKLAENVARAITLTKIDGDTNKALEKVEFALYDEVTGSELTGFTKSEGAYIYDQKGSAKLLTDAKGLLQIRNLPAGSFYLKEIKPLDDYKPLEDTSNYFPFELSLGLPEDGGKIIEINNGNAIKNYKEDVEEQLYDLKVIKKGSDDVVLPTVKFDLYTAADNRLVGSYVTDANGTFTVSNLSAGSYYLVETQGADGYDYDSSIHYNVTLSGDETVITKTIINEKKKAPIDPTDPVDPGRPSRPDPDKPTVDIPEEDVPLGPGEEIVDIIDEDVPLSDGGANAFVEIEDEEVPLGAGVEVPNTKDSLYYWIPVLALSALGIMLLNVLRRKCAE
ncbi:MSCRAMM family protein [Dielma fastidiosa]|uniref:MSCRAMM family protein n=1 Tax=Dielma fastidiosa TaxID=1034346 RepID=UPI003563424C